MHENGNGGTDHGHGNVMWVMGGPVKGGKVYGRWPGLSTASLYQERDLAVTTDFRDPIAAVLRLAHAIFRRANRSSIPGPPALQRQRRRLDQGVRAWQREPRRRRLLLSSFLTVIPSAAEGPGSFAMPETLRLCLRAREAE